MIRRLLIFALLTGCTRSRAPVVVADAAEGGAPPIADAGGPADAADAADAAPSCEPTTFQHDACIAPRRDLTLGNDAIAAWLSARGAKPPEYTFEMCREEKLGADGEDALVCIDLTPRAMDPSMGLNGPVEHRYDVDVVVVRNHRRVEILRAPYSFGLSSTSYLDVGDMYFSAQFRIDAPSATIELLAPKAECDAAVAELRPYWADQSAEVKKNIAPPFGLELARAMQLQRVQDEERIKATCAAAGRYVRANAASRFVKSK